MRWRSLSGSEPGPMVDPHGDWGTPFQPMFKDRGHEFQLQKQPVIRDGQCPKKPIQSGSSGIHAGDPRLPALSGITPCRAGPFWIPASAE